METSTYKFKAENMLDIVTLLQVMMKAGLRDIREGRPQRGGIVALRIEPFDREHLFPDRECIIEVWGWSQSQLAGFIEKVTDGHVMRQTLKPLSEYTGDRNRNE